MKHKGRLIVLIVFIAFSMVTYAQEVDYETAKTIATSFIAVKKENTQKSNPAISQQHTVYGDAENPLLYIFNFEDDGFVIVSANKNVEPILVYSTTGKFLIDEVNPAAKMWINAYIQEISYAVETKTNPTSEMTNKWNEAEKGNFLSKVQKAAVVEPLLTSKWNQNRYYNALCPDTIVGGGFDDHTPNGCVALAMAQIMYYHRYPRNGVGTSSYTCEGYGLQRADYLNANYNYEAMSDEATGYSNAIAQLCYHAGVSVQMNYKAAGSGALTTNAKIAFPARFAYKSPEIHSRGTNEASWKSWLKTDLNRGLPIYYSACNTNAGSRDNCHAFVCDGYDENDMFHFNWGWGGNSDAYYKITEMLGYLTNSDILIGVEPYRETIISAGIDTLTATYGSFSDGSPPRLDYVNNTNRSWLLSPQNGKNITKITLKTSYFSTEEGNDIVTVYSGDKVDPDSVIAVLSGKLNNTKCDVNASQCLVTFISNGSITDKGFKFTYTSTAISDNLCPSQIPSSTNFYDQSQGTISSNAEDVLYEDATACYWAIKPRDNQKVGLVFTKFDLEEGDFVELYTWNGTSNLNSLKYWTHGKYRFTKENPPVLNQEYLILSVGAYVSFRTDNNLNASGFELNWHTTTAVQEFQMGIATIQIFPNPAQDVLTIQIETVQPEKVQLSLYDVVGRKLSDISTAEATQQTVQNINVSNLAKGMYLLQITTSQGRVMRKIAIE